jgi:hypothetical protein
VLLLLRLNSFLCWFTIGFFLFALIVFFNFWCVDGVEGDFSMDLGNMSYTVFNYFMVVLACDYVLLY